MESHGRPTEVDVADVQQNSIHSTWPVLTAVFAEAAAAVVGALVAGNVARQAGTLAGLRVLTRDMLLRARAHHDAFGPVFAPRWHDCSTIWKLRCRLHAVPAWHA